MALDMQVHTEPAEAPAVELLPAGQGRHWAVLLTEGLKADEGQGLHTEFVNGDA